MGEGYVASWVSFAGIMAGLLVAGYTWSWWWATAISNGPQLWLPHLLGHAGAVVLTLLALLIIYFLVVWWETRSGMVLPDLPFAGAADTFAGQIGAMLRRVFVQGSPIAGGGAVLGGLNALLFVASHPWGFTGEVLRWVVGIANALGIGPGELQGAANLPGCALEVSDSGILHHMFFMVWGMVFGSFGAGIAMGCTIGAFFSAIPSLAVNGWVFALFLAAGAWIGSQIIRRLD